MLILVGVTINFALNGGIINKAKQAGNQYQIEADREALLSCVIASIGIDGKVDFAELDREVAKIGFTGTNGTYTSKAGNTFTVDEDGNITYTGAGGGQAEDTDLAYLKTLIGQDFMDLIADMSGPTFKDPNLELDMVALNNLSSDDIVENQDGSYDMSYPFYYKGKPYSIVVREDPNNSIVTILDVTTRIPSSNTSNSSSSSEESSEDSSVAYIESGSYVYYGNMLWIVLYNDEFDGLQLVSANTLESGNVYLGYNDNMVDWIDANVISEANIFEDTESRTKCVIKC